MLAWSGGELTKSEKYCAFMRPEFGSDSSYNGPGLKENLGFWGVMETL